MSQGYHFLHDDREATLGRIFTRSRHQIDPDLPSADLEDLLRCLRSLSKGGGTGTRRRSAHLPIPPL